MPLTSLLADNGRLFSTLGETGAVLATVFFCVRLIKTTWAAAQAAQNDTISYYRDQATTARARVTDLEQRLKDREADLSRLMIERTEWMIERSRLIADPDTPPPGPPVG